MPLQLLVLALAAFAYAPLFRMDAGALDQRIESWLFIPSDSSTVAVLVLAAWLLFRRSPAYRALPDSPRPLPALALMVLGVGIYAWASLTRAGDLLLPSLAANALGYAVWQKGTAGVRAVWVPAVFLVFALPIPPPLLNELVFSLQLVTAEYAGWLLRAIGEAVFISGDQIIRSDQHFQVIESCSGMRSAETLTMLAVLLVDLFRRSGLHAAVILVLAAPVAFVFNGLRVVAVILLPHSEIVAIHTVQGVGILLGGLVTLYLIDGVLEGRGSKRPAVAASVRDRDEKAGDGKGGGSQALAATQSRDGAPTGDAGVRSVGARLVPVAILLLCLAIGTWATPWSPEHGGSQKLLHYRIPTTLGAWHATNLGIDRNFLGSAGYGDVLHRQYRDGSDSVDLFLSAGNRRARHRSPFSPTTGIPGSGWIVDETGPQSLGGSGLEVQSRVVRSGTRRMLVYHWYEGTDGLRDETLRSALALDASPLHRPGKGLAVRIATPLPSGDTRELEPARGRLIRFYEQLRLELGALQSDAAGKTFS